SLRYLFSSACFPRPRVLPSSPTRRSSDLQPHLLLQPAGQSRGRGGPPARTDGRAGNSRRDRACHPVEAGGAVGGLVRRRPPRLRSEEHTPELHSPTQLACRLLL